MFNFALLWNLNINHSEMTSIVFATAIVELKLLEKLAHLWRIDPYKLYGPQRYVPYWSDPQYNARYPQCLLWFLKSSFSHENWRHPLNVSAWRLREGSQCFPVIFPRYSQVLPRLGRPRRLNHRAEVTSEQSRRKRSQRADVPTYPEGTF